VRCPRVSRLANSRPHSISDGKPQMLATGLSVPIAERDAPG